MPVILDASTPLSSGEFAAVDLDRLAEVNRRHQLVSEFLVREGYAGLALQQPCNLAWLTAGADLSRGTSGETTAALFITPDARVVVCGNADTAELFEHHVPGLGFQLKERPWTEPRQVMLGDLCRGRKIASDAPLPGTTDIGLRMLGLRTPLSEYEHAQLREAGRRVAHAVEATARAIVRGRTEAETAGELSHRLLKHEVHPFRMQILADGRAIRFRHWTWSDSPIQKFCTVAAVGRFRGLNVGAARTISLGEPPEQLLAAFQKAAMVHATGLFFSQVEWEFFEIWNRIRRIYEKSGADEEWRLADQASLCEYQYGAVPLTPNSEFRLPAGVPLHWHPSVGPIACGDTLLTTPKGAEVLTRAIDWPHLSISVKGTAVPVPAVLVLES
ncbi:M24 family metallopeptidase [Planctellipticum variicoloris]|jgi:Xaa-Pro aminopeptidase|uniref:M24 family metallopeptidase n=1 Tax=Planctellipticum variicoloris TaxID=3064265 RepID=UPI0030135CCB|nr:M24 family metallopeptidase [Planctomycetaceae bacterium SH412]